MVLSQLQGFGLRCFSEFTLTPISGVNLLIGENGSGKTTLIEAIHILGYGRSFRGRIRDGIIKQSDAQLQIIARWKNDKHEPQQAGFQHSGSAWDARINGSGVESLSQFCEYFPVLTFEPGSHELITGSSDNRRRFIDWSLFHVKQDFFSQWRRYHRALKQRNALLKAQPSSRELEPWDIELAESGELLSFSRTNYLNQVEPLLQTLVHAFLPESGPVGIVYAPGWRTQQVSLLDALRLNRDRDIQAGFCTVGPHRADWQISLNGSLQKEHFSRGQAKLLALAALLAQAQNFHFEKGFWPILCFDDLASELDQHHLANVLKILSTTSAQLWISGTDLLTTYTENFDAIKAFHVKQATVSEA